MRRPNISSATERRNVQLAGQAVTYTLKRSNKRRTIGLRIDDRGLTVNMPLRASEKWLASVLHEKAEWVVATLAKLEAKKSDALQWVDGEAILFQGETYNLCIVASLFDAAPQLHRTHLVVYTPRPDDRQEIEKIVVQWYRQQALQLFVECVGHFAPLMKVHPREIKLSSALTQWGSCTTKGTVRLNWQLIRMPLALIDYVVIHELAHLIEMNHSAAFWRVVATMCPDYLQLRAILKKWTSMRIA
jgi:predicted metal-dependent hydrolase